MKKIMVKVMTVFVLVFIFCSSPPAAENAWGSGAQIYINNGRQTTSPVFSSEDDFKVIKLVNGSFNKYIDYARGYSLYYPNHMWVDTTLSQVRTVIADEDMQIEIYYDNFYGTVHTADTYIHYSNRFKFNTKDHTLEKDETIRINGLRTHLLKWHRNKLANIANDKNYYVNAKIIKNRYEVYTIFMKAARPMENYMEIMGSFSLEERKGTPGIHTTYKNMKKNFNEETETFFKKYFLENDALKWGIFEWTTTNGFSFLKSLEERLDYTFDFMVRYQSLDSDFPRAEMIDAYNNNKYVELTLQTEHIPQGREENHGVIYSLLNGEYDDFLHQYAGAIKEFGHPVLFRLNNEMNGDWCLYSSYYHGNDTELFKAAWRYIYHIFEQNGVDNVLWIWNPHDSSFPGFMWNHYLTYYPGNRFVDIIGLTGYNPGTYFTGERWRSFKEIYPPLYEEYSAVFEQPFVITEFGSSSVGGDKIAWLEEMFGVIGQFENIKAAIWWNGIDYDREGNPGRIYRLDETAEILETFKNGLQKFKPKEDI